MSATIDTEANVLTSVQEGVMTMTLNRPKRLNSIDVHMADEIAAACATAADDAAVRAVVITSAGRAFSAGGALEGDIGDLDMASVLAEHFNKAIQALDDLDKPTVAAIRNLAVGAGLSVAMACDFRIVTEGAKLAMVFVRVGLAPDMGGSYFLPRLVGRARATEMAMLGDDVPVERALEIGLVNRVVPDGELESATLELAQRLANGPASLMQVKRQLRVSLDNDLATQLEVESETQAAASRTEDFAEGLSAFLEKRPAEFTGR